METKDTLTDFIGFRSKDLAGRINRLVEANPHLKGLKSDIIRTALDEKLNRIESGDDAAFKLKTVKVPPSAEILSALKKSADELRRATQKNPAAKPPRTKPERA